MAKIVTGKDRELIVGSSPISKARSSLKQALIGQLTKINGISSITLQTDGDLRVQIRYQDSLGGNHTQTIIITKTVLDQFIELNPDHDFNADGGMVELLAHDIGAKLGSGDALSGDAVVTVTNAVEVDTISGSLLVQYTIDDAGKISQGEAVLTRTHYVDRFLSFMPAETVKAVGPVMKICQDKDSIFGTNGIPWFNTSKEQIIAATANALGTLGTAFPDSKVPSDPDAYMVDGDMVRGNVVSVRINTENYDLCGGLTFAILSETGQLAYNPDLLDGVVVNLHPNDEDPQVLGIYATVPEGKKIIITGAALERSMEIPLPLRYNQNWIYVPAGLDAKAEDLSVKYAVVDDVSYIQDISYPNVVVTPPVVEEPTPTEPTPPDTSTPEPELTADQLMQRRLLLNIIYQGTWLVGEDSDQNPIYPHLYFWDSETPQFEIHGYPEAGAVEFIVRTTSSIEQPLDWEWVGTPQGFKIKFPQSLQSYTGTIEVQTSQNGIDKIRHVIPVTINHGP